MNKTVKYILCGLSASLLFVSCELNKQISFTDDKAFVAFDKSAVSIDEATVLPSGDIVDNTSTLKIPVTLASVKGLQETIKFTIIDTANTFTQVKNGETLDKTAKNGVNFVNLSTSGTLSFDAEHRTQYIEIEPKYFDEYTGDLKFKIVLSAGESVGLGYVSECVVTISDVNHPLTAILGGYTCTSTHPSQKNNPWTMTFFKDPEDDHMIWIDNIFANPGWAASDTRFYGNVNEELTEIIIPYGQASEYVYSNGNPVSLLWLDVDGNGDVSGQAVVTILKNDNGAVTGLEFAEDKGFCGYIENAGSVGLAWPQISAVKN